jgi:hypothetical protein
LEEAEGAALPLRRWLPAAGTRARGHEDPRRGAEGGGAMGDGLTTLAAGAAASATFAASLAQYARTLYASVPGGDAGELLAEACALGQAHPPGYPLFTMMYHTWMRSVPSTAAAAWGVPLPATAPGAPAGSGAELEASLTAWKANLLSALLGAGAASFVALTVSVLGQGRGHGAVASALAGAGAGVGFALSELAWQYSIGAEVFALNNFMVAVLVWLTVRYGAARSAWERELWVALGALWSGLALTNQHTAVLFEAALVGWVLWFEWRARGLRPARLALWSSLFVVGLTPYAYLPWAQLRRRQQGSWGDSTTLAGLVHHLRRGDYGTFRLFSGATKDHVGALERTALYLRDLAMRQGAIVVLPMALAGAWQLARSAVAAVAAATTAAASDGEAARRRKDSGSKRQSKGAGAAPSAAAAAAAAALAAPSTLARSECAAEQAQRASESGGALVFAWVLYLVVFHVLSNMPLDQRLLFGVQARFWMQPNMLAFCFAAVALLSLSERAAARAPLAGPAARARWLLRCLCVAGAGAALGAHQVARNGALLDMSGNRYFEMYARSLLASLPPASVLIVGWDQQWTSLRYLQQCLGARPDVTVLNGPMLSYRWMSSYVELYHADPNKCVRFPGTHWVVEGHAEHVRGRADMAYSVRDFVEASSASCPGGVFWTGNLPFGKLDQGYNRSFAAVNMGPVSQFVRKGELGGEMTPEAAKLFGPKQVNELDRGIAFLGVDKWISRTLRAWQLAHREMTSFPSAAQFSDETWEWTLAKDWSTHMSEDGANLLTIAIERDDLSMMAYAAFLLERATDLTEFENVAPSLLKNLGLAYVKMVQSKQKEFVPSPLFPPPVDGHLRGLFGDQWRGKDAPWRNVAAVRAYETWTRFVATDGADKDSSYHQVVAVLSALRPAAESGAAKQAQAQTQT